MPDPLPQIMLEPVEIRIEAVRSFKSWSVVELYSEILEATGLPGNRLPMGVRDAVVDVMHDDDWTAEQMYAAVRDAHNLPHEFEAPLENSVGAPPGQGENQVRSP